MTPQERAATPKRLEIAFGALAPPLRKQLGRDGVLVRQWQKDADAIVRLSVRGLLTWAEMHSARKRLMKRIVEDQ